MLILLIIPSERLLGKQSPFPSEYIVNNIFSGEILYEWRSARYLNYVAESISCHADRVHDGSRGIPQGSWSVHNHSVAITSLLRADADYLQHAARARVQEVTRIQVPRGIGLHAFDHRHRAGMSDRSQRRGTTQQSGPCGR